MTFFCITVTDNTSECKFSLMPDSNNSNMALEKDESGNWTTILGESSVQLQEITIESAFNEEEGNTGVTIPVAVTYAPGDEFNFISDIPMTVTVHGNQTSVSSGDMWYYYETGTTSSDIRIGFDFDIDGSEILYITNYLRTDMFMV